MAPPKGGGNRHTGVGGGVANRHSGRHAGGIGGQPVLVVQASQGRIRCDAGGAVAIAAEIPLQPVSTAVFDNRQTPAVTAAHKAAGRIQGMKGFHGSLSPFNSLRQFFELAKRHVLYLAALPHWFCYFPRVVASR